MDISGPGRWGSKDGCGCWGGRLVGIEMEAGRRRKRESGSEKGKIKEESVREEKNEK